MNALAPKPKRKAPSSYLPEAQVAPSGNAAPDLMKATRWFDMNFKVDEQFRRRFRLTASAAGISNKALLEEAFDLWLAHNSERLKDLA